jgi:Protein of unknown function (DUF2510)
MYEFDSVSVSSYEAASLAAKLSEKSADGWDVVAIVPAGSDVVAYVKRSSSSSGATASESPAATTTTPGDATAPEAAAAAAAVGEPAGWGSAPAAGATGSSWGSGSSNDSGSSIGATTGATTDTSSGWGASAGAPVASSTPTTQAQQPATPSVPAGWYHDPAGRYELRYWDGSAWTEHVSRAGQQYTDPPVA